MNLDVLAFGAHPDDIELTCSGTLIKLASMGYATGMISLTAGELGTRGDKDTRAREFENAAGVMELKAHEILGLPDGKLNCEWEQKFEVIKAVRSWKPRIVLAPYWKDRHPDHANASKLVTEASFLAGLSKIQTGQDACRPFRIIYYPCRYEFRPSFIVDVSKEHVSKMEAIRCYRSQFHQEGHMETGESKTNISHPGFLEAIEARGRQYGSYIGTDYGEPFLVREPMRLDDPVEFFGAEYLNTFV